MNKNIVREAQPPSPLHSTIHKVAQNASGVAWGNFSLDGKGNRYRMAR
jgi:hypothetical protein